MPIVFGTTANTAEFHQVTVKGRGRDKLCAAVALRISGNYKPSDLELSTWLLCKGIVVLGHGNRSTELVLASAIPTTAYQYYDAAAAAALVGTGGMPSPLFADIGEAEEVEALARARQMMQANLDRAAEMTFVIVSGITRLPRKGSTVWIGQGAAIYKGVVQDARFTMTAGAERLEVRIVDYTAVNFA